MLTTTRGTVAMIIATSLWGTFSLIFAQLAPMSPTDIIAHRVVWGMIMMLGWLVYQGRLRELLNIWRSKRELLWLLVSAFLVAVNWLGFVYAVSTGQGLEASLGYFIFPIATVIIGVLVKKDTLNHLQTFSVGFAILAIAVLTYGLGKIPWIAIGLAVSFASYGFVKSNVSFGAVLSVSAENILLFPLAALWLTVFADHNIGILSSPIKAFWIVMIGGLTGAALIAFSYATKTISFVAVGCCFLLIQFSKRLTPQFFSEKRLLFGTKLLSH